MGGLPRPEIPPGSQRDLVDALHHLHHRAGWPSLRVLAGAAGCSHTTISKVFSSARLPTWGVIEVVVEAMDGDVAQFRRLWLAASAPDAASAPAHLLIAGRQHELRVVRRHLEGGTGLLAVTGEAGMGKTRLVGAASTLAAGSTFVAAGSCLPLSSQVPLLPVADALRAAYDVDDGQWVKEAVADCAPYVAGSLSRVLPELDLALGAPIAPDDEWARQRLFGAIEATLSALASLRPLAVLLEDLHWADSATLDLVEHLLAGRVAVPVLGTWRLHDPTTPEPTAEWWTRVQRLPTCATLDLKPLSRAETAEQVGLLVTGPADPDLVDRIHHRSQGQPLFTEQLTGLDDAEELPRRLGELLDQRLSGLDEQAWGVARALGVADRSLSDVLLADVTGLGSRELTGALHELGARNLLRSAAGHHVDLRHPLLAEAIRRRLVALELADEHRRIALALARSTDPSPAEVAEHWRRAEDPAEEVGWRVRAAQAAGERFAVAQAAEQWRRALAIWPVDGGSLGTPPVRKRDAYLAAMDAMLFTDVVSAWEVAQEGMQDLADVMGVDAAETYRRAAAISGWLGDPARGVGLVDRAIAILDSDEPSVGLVRAWSERDTLLDMLGRYDEARVCSARALEVCASLDAPQVYRGLLIQQSLHDADEGDVEEALAHLDEAGRMDMPTPDPGGDIHLAVTATYILLLAGRVGDEVVKAGLPGLEAAATWGIETYPAHVVRGNVAFALRLAGQIRRAAEIIDPVTAFDEPRHEDAAVQFQRAYLDMVRGRRAQALARFDLLARIPDPILSNLLEFTEGISEADLWCGRPDVALDRTVSVLRDAVATEASIQTGGVLVLAARAASDVASADGGDVGARRERLALLQSLLGDTRHDPFEPSPAFASRAAHSAAWAAETARLVGRSTVELWGVAAGRWDRIGRPHDAAYCRWRGAQVALAAGQGTIALRLLTRATRDAREHVPLSAAIAETLARAPRPR
ncbi:MAG: AAA family ATPase [Nocardioides sp.]